VPPGRLDREGEEVTPATVRLRKLVLDAKDRARVRARRSGRVAVQSRTMVMSSARKASPGARPAAETVTLSLLVPGRRTW
jgi:hypothetical protein